MRCRLLIEAYVHTFTIGAIVSCYPCLHQVFVIFNSVWVTHLAGKVWRLIYLCNPRLVAVQQPVRTADEAASSEGGSNSSSGRSSPWSWVPLKLLPPALMSQRQERATLSCDLHTAEDYHYSTLQDAQQAETQATDEAAEVVEGLWEAVSSDTESFCARHPGYAHWLYGVAFELEWGNHVAAVPLTTWDC